jgi:calcineurin-like phosphoesterase family protein
MAGIRGFLRPLQGEGDSYSAEELSSALHEMNETLIENFNSLVRLKDTVYHLGDFAFCKDEPAIAILKRLHGRITLIQGNHDKKRKYVKAFPETYDLREIKIDGQYVVMCHYPLLVWNKHHHGAIHLHGHSHGTLKWPTDYYERQVMDVGVDCHKLFPISWEEIREVMKDRMIQALDHHREGHYD